MSIRFNKVLDLSVVSQESGSCLGKIGNLIIDYDTGKFLALVVSGEEIMGGSKIVKADRIRTFDQDRALVEDDSSFEVLTPGRIQDIVQSKIKIKGNKVVTQGGTTLGKVIDFEINLDSNKLSCIFIKTKILGRPLVIFWDQIVSVGKEAIIVKDQAIKIKAFEPGLVGA